MSTKETFTLTVQDEGPVKISPRARNDLTWLARNELEKLPKNLSKLKRANKDTIETLAPDFWKYFPTTYAGNLNLIDQRSGPAVYYPRAVEQVKKGSVSLGSPFMEASGDLLDDYTAQADVYVYTHPHYRNKKLSQVKWGEDDTLYAISSIKHEFGHVAQWLLCDILRKSELGEGNHWPHTWVTPFFCLEGYTLVQEGASVLNLQNDKYASQPLLRKAVRLEEVGRKFFNVDKDVIEKGLNAWHLQMLDLDFANKDQVEQFYTLNQLIYFSLIGLRAGVSPVDMMDEIKSTPAFEATKEDLISLDIKEKSKVLSLPFAPWIEDQSSQIELEMQAFYYRNHSDLAWAGDAAYKQYKKKEEAIPDKVRNLNSLMLKKILSGFTRADLIGYANELITQVSRFAQSSPYFAQRSTHPNSVVRAISVYSGRTENPYYPILERQLSLDGISDDRTHGRH